MEQFTMNEDIRAQLKYYTAKLCRLQAEKMPLEDTIAALMYRRRTLWTWCATTTS